MHLIYSNTRVINVLIADSKGERCDRNWCRYVSTRRYSIEPMERLKFSANLGFLWNDRTLPEAINAAATAGFDAVECHWPYVTPAKSVSVALGDAGLSMMSINAPLGDIAKGDKGLAAVPGREVEAIAGIDVAIKYAAGIDAKFVHVLAGNALGEEARRTFLRNLRYALEKAKNDDVKILIEPLNAFDAPDYFLNTTDQARGIIESVADDNLRLMFDFYHVQLSEGALTRRLQALLPVIGHIQFSGVPGRTSPDRGEIKFKYIFQWLADRGWDAPLGAEYIPDGDTGDSLGWLSAAREIRAMLPK